MHGMVNLRIFIADGAGKHHEMIRMSSEVVPRVGEGLRSTESSLIVTSVVYEVRSKPVSIDTVEIYTERTE